jgi:hypothetical protein
MIVVFEPQLAKRQASEAIIINLINALFILTILAGAGCQSGDS